MERTSVIALHSWFATAGGIPKKCPLITAAVMVYMLYPVVLTFETITLLDVTKPQRFGKDALTEVAFIGVPMLVWFFVSVTALVCVVKREIVKYPLWNGGKTAQIIIGNFLVCQIFLIFFTVAACISVMVHIDGRRSYLVAAAECFLIVWQISLFIYFDAYRINLKKRPKRIESELSDRTRTVYIIVPVECHQIAGSNETEGLPSYDEIAQTYENNQVVPVV
ncbi:hypothetical protein L596_026655 [Steinernema carpocapsae]|uniref:Uncharacterized protein n=1 Tax=Steinernema carpocapsae TaxID=34508 RepID=A0A4V5ZYG9_STECR|nr:hypothetical protein L596_026655 [Steinernema carpocapsae]